MISSGLQFIRISFGTAFLLGVISVLFPASAQATSSLCEMTSHAKANTACAFGTRGNTKSIDESNNAGVARKSIAIAEGLDFGRFVTSCHRSTGTSSFRNTSNRSPVCWRYSEKEINACFPCAGADNSWIPICYRQTRIIS